MSAYKRKEVIGDATLLLGDCLERMQEIPDGSIDAIISDPPYGMTACEWDSIIDLPLMWEQLKRVIKPNGAIVMTASQPFTSALVMSNPKMFKYCWVWEKNRASGHVHAKNKPMKAHEDILVFSNGTTVHASQSTKRMTYNPQKTKGKAYQRTFKTEASVSGNINHSISKSNKSLIGKTVVNNGDRYPRTVVNFLMHNVGNSHPTQKPVALMEYLIKTYTNAGETVMDFAFGSGTTGVACANIGRKFTGIELDPDYYAAAVDRIDNAHRQGKLFEATT